MQLLPKELSMASYVLHNASETLPNGMPSPRQLPTEDMEAAVGLNTKIKACIDEGANVFLESEVEFTTAEKCLLLKFIERAWPVEDAEVYLSLKAKLS